MSPSRRRRLRLREGTLLRYSSRFFVVASVAAVLGFVGIAGEAAGIARILFVVFAAAFAITLFFGLVAAMKGRAPLGRRSVRA